MCITYVRLLMDYSKACRTLGLTNARDEKIYLTAATIKKAYYKQALLYHPDKESLNKRDKVSRSPNDGATAKGKAKNIKIRRKTFADIQNAYEFLMTDLEISQGVHNAGSKKSSVKYGARCRRRGSRKKHTPPRDNLKHVDYFSIFVSFAKMISPTIIERWGPEYIQSTLKNLFTSYRAATIIPELFRELSKERAIELYDFMLQYREYINVDDQTIIEVRDIIREKMSDDHLVILNPSLEQMWGDELYRHEFMGNEYLIPLWWPEVTFQKEDHTRPHSGGDLRVKMIPDLPPSVFIDRGNNIHLTKQYDMAAMRHVLDDTGEFTVSLLSRTYRVPKVKIRFVKERQIILLGEDGLLPVNKKNMYDTSVRRSVFCHLFLKDT